MADATMAAAAALTAVQATLYLSVAKIVGRRQIIGAEGQANAAFALWWGALGGLYVFSSLKRFAGSMGYVSLPMEITSIYASLLLIMAALWGLTYYLAYLYSGRSTVRVPLMAFYGAMYLVLLFLVVRADPSAIEPGRWGPSLVYANEAARADMMRVAVPLLIVPPLVGALLYGSLFFRMKTPLARYRIGLVGGAFVLWFGGSLLATSIGFNQSDAWFLGGRLLAILAALMVLVAFRPPKSLERRWGQTA